MHGDDDVETCADGSESGVLSIAQKIHTNGPYVLDFAIVGPPVGRATRPPAGPTAGNPAYSLETKGRWYQTLIYRVAASASEW